MDILFWSGGKDSYLALKFFKQDYECDDLKMLTTYDRTNSRIPHQNLALSTIKEQAKFLKSELLAVPLPPDCPNEVYVKKVRETLDNQRTNLRYLIFGDWYLDEIRKWREEVFGGMGFECLFPIWEKPLDELLPVLLFNPVEVKISAVADEYKDYLKIGETYNQQLVRQLPDQIDPMGEKGEFHTEVIFPEPEAKAELQLPV